jgi:hypothetical protein
MQVYLNGEVFITKHQKCDAPEVQRCLCNELIFTFKADVNYFPSLIKSLGNTRQNKLKILILHVAMFLYL